MCSWMSLRIFKLYSSYSITIYRLDVESKGSMGFGNPRALSCSIPSLVRALLRA